MHRCDLGLIGWGTVGGGVSRILSDDAALLRERCGLDLRLRTIVTRTPARAREAPNAGATVTDRLDAILGDPEIRTVIHLVGGTTDATEICTALLRAGKNVVTANKAMLALHGDDLFRLAADRGLCIAFEAAVAGGIPVIAALRDGLVANHIQSISGILNGTCNYILSRMESDGWSYGAALAEAQRLGYAETDPTLDVDGTDTAHKLAILARIAFNGRIPFSAIRTEGIQSITFEDILSAKTMGCRIKLLAVATRRAQGLELRVAPTLVPIDHPLASVAANHNGIFIAGHAVGTTLLVGQGAGALPTASAVLADVVDVCTGRYQATANRFAFFTQASPVAILPENEELTGSYARFVVPDRTGVLAGIATILSTHGVSLLSIHQAAPRSDGSALIEAVTHPHRGGSFLKAVEEIDQSRLTIRPTVTLRRL
ncbi:MAG TPA: homoserine dehydrogenase [Planctomycetota bacterium]|nr:homoserine dehydrogenase [Planctomycetota bacterium]